jgi:hypothetical protein
MFTDDQFRKRLNLLEARIERVEKILGPLDDRLRVNSGDWIGLDSVCIGDVVGGVEIRTKEQMEIVNKAGEELKKLDRI